MENKQNSGVKRRRGLETQESIFKISAALFAQKGYDAVTVREIASASKIKESSIYNHFESKAAILTSLFDFFSQEVAKARLSDAELESLMAFMSGEEILKQLIVRMGQREEPTLDYVATIIFTERFRNKDAANLYFDWMIESQWDYYTTVFALMNSKGLISCPEDRVRDIASQYNYVLVALATEYAMAKNGMVDGVEAIKKMMATASFFAGQGGILNVNK